MYILIHFLKHYINSASIIGIIKIIELYNIPMVLPILILITALSIKLTNAKAYIEIFNLLLSDSVYSEFIFKYTGKKYWDNTTKYNSINTTLFVLGCKELPIEIIKTLMPNTTAVTPPEIVFPFVLQMSANELI
jgi:hypothetical protein